jgi:hypothetical protein
MPNTKPSTPHSLPSTTHPPSPTTDPKRPFSVTILVILVLIFTSLNALRMITAVRSQEFLTGLTFDIPVGYLTITGALWTLIGLPLLVGLFFGRGWSGPLLKWAAGFYTVYYWIEHLFVTEPEVLTTRWPFTVGLNLTLMILVFWTLSRPKPREFLTR